MGSSSSSKNTSIIILVALVATVLLAVYYYLVFPKQNEVQTLNNSISSLQTQISALESNIEQVQSGQESGTSSEFALRKRLPESREIDELLMNIEEIEYVTNSIVTSIGFSSYDSLVSESGLVSEKQDQAAGQNPNDQPTDGTQVQEGTQTTDGTQVQEGTQTTEGETVTNDDQQSELASDIASSLPPELKLISFNIQVESPDYEHLLEFINEIENLERIMHVDSINYTLPGEEVEFTEEAVETLSASIQVTTFYYEGE